MKKCLKCGAENRDENKFCSICGGTEFSDIAEDRTGANGSDTVNSVIGQLPPPAQIPPMTSGRAPGVPPAGNIPNMQTLPPARPPFYPQHVPKKPFGICDVLTILGFVSALVGLVSSWVILEPLGFITSVIGFVKNTRYKGLAAAGFVIAVIAFIIKLLVTLYNNNIIGRWAIDGIFA